MQKLVRSLDELYSLTLLGLSYDRTVSIEEEQPLVKCPVIYCTGAFSYYPLNCFKPTVFWRENRLCPGCLRNTCLTHPYSQSRKQMERPVQRYRKQQYSFAKNFRLTQKPPLYKIVRIKSFIIRVSSIISNHCSTLGLNTTVYMAFCRHVNPNTIQYKLKFRI